MAKTYDTTTEDLLHVPDSRFISFSTSVADFIERRMHELNSDASSSDKLCLGCMATVLFDTALILGAKNLDHDKRVSEWLMELANMFGQGAYDADRHNNSAKSQRERVLTMSDKTGMQ